MGLRSWDLSVAAKNWGKWLAIAIILVIAAVGAPHLLGSRASASQGPKPHLRQTLSTAGSEYSALRKIYSRHNDDDAIRLGAE